MSNELMPKDDVEWRKRQLVLQQEYDGLDDGKCAC